MRSVAGAIVALGLAGGSAYPCALERVSTVTDALREADAVFVGIVEDVSDQAEGSPNPQEYVRRARLNVREVWKGPRRQHLTVWTLPGEGMCGVPFQPGRLFLVFASGKADALATSIVLPSKLLPKGEAVPKALGQSRWRNPRWGGSEAATSWETPQNNQMQLTSGGLGLEVARAFARASSLSRRSQLI